uniref:MARVEL domain-containing protein n=1 Tax=Strigamia maritima TaxID=126957 RepID=T1IX79_STRMM
MAVAFRWIITPNGILRIIAFLTIIIIMVLIHVYPYGKMLLDEPTIGIYYAHVISAGNFFVLLFFIVGYITGEVKMAQNFITEIIFDISHAILTIIAGALLLHGYDVITSGKMSYKHENEDTVLAIGLLFLILTILLLVDAALQFIFHMAEFNVDWAKEPIGFVRSLALLLSIISLGLFIDKFFRPEMQLVAEFDISSGNLRPSKVFHRMSIFVSPS